MKNQAHILSLAPIGGNNMKLFQSALFEVNVGVGVCVGGGGLQEIFTQEKTTEF